jgi:thiopurine S-methyltransferase
MFDEWIARWRDRRINFHEGHPNALLERHHTRLADHRRVLVPLCGKTEDLAFLAAHGHEVVGIELAEQAVREFFTDHAVTPSIAQRGPFVAYTAPSITLLAGDFFATTPELLGPIDALYDRAALVALPAELRPRYVQHLRALLPAATPGLVITYEYDQRLVTGPPFAVLEPELRAHYAGRRLELLDERPGDVTRCAEAGVPVIERCFALGN